MVNALLEDCGAREVAAACLEEGFAVDEEVEEDEERRDVAVSVEELLLAFAGTCLVGGSVETKEKEGIRTAAGRDEELLVRTTALDDSGAEDLCEVEDVIRAEAASATKRAEENGRSIAAEELCAVDDEEKVAADEEDAAADEEDAAAEDEEMMGVLRVVDEIVDLCPAASFRDCGALLCLVSLCSAVPFSRFLKKLCSLLSNPKRCTTLVSVKSPMLCSKCSSRISLDSSWRERSCSLSWASCCFFVKGWIARYRWLSSWSVSRLD